MPRTHLQKLIIPALLLVLFVAALPALAQERSGTLSIPAAGIEAPIVPIYLRQFGDGSITWDTSTLNMSVGHLDGTAWFGEGGNIVLGGHSELARGQADIFYNLDQVQVGHEIIVNVNGSEIRYTVTRVYTVSLNDLTPIYPTSGETLTLITCDLRSFEASSGVYHNRIVVVAQRTG